MVPTENFDATVAFYRETLGLAEMPVPATGYAFESAWLRAGDVEFHVVAKDEHLLEAETQRNPGQPAVFNPTLQLHLAFEVESADEAIRTLDSAGTDYTIFAGEGPTTRRQIFFRDPSGTMVELYEVAPEGRR
jgi:catechol 2,3-dioxygenase-like lactoylglutathione lyase family enzyme